MFLFGYNTGVLNAPEAIIFSNQHTTLQWSLAVSGFCVGGIFGANGSGKWVDVWGRRRSLLAVFGGYGIAGVMSVVTPSMNGLIATRVLIGVAGGASTVITPMYLSEISPTRLKGTIGTLTQLSVVIGILASILWELPFHSVDKWRFIFLPIPVIGVMGLVVGYCVLLESPSWLLRVSPSVERRREAVENIRLLRYVSGDIYSNEDEDNIVELVREGTNSTAAQTNDAVDHDSEPLDDPERDLDAITPANPEDPPPPITTTTNPQPPPSFKSYITNPQNRIPLLSSILLPIAQQLSGINAVFYYSTSLFEGVIPNPQTGTILAFTVNVVATIVAVLVMDRFGRKTLLTLSAGGMFLCCILLTLSLEGILPPLLAVVGVMLYIIFFELGLGCIPFFLASELIQPEFLGRVQSISMSCNWIANFGVGLLFPYMDYYLGSFSFLPFAVFLGATVVFCVVLLPETGGGRSIREVTEELAERRRRRWGQEDILFGETDSPFVETVRL